jgi:hypothetical protein
MKMLNKKKGGKKKRQSLQKIHFIAFYASHALILLLIQIYSSRYVAFVILVIQRSSTRSRSIKI